jgi:hypothetical protein
MGDRPLPGSFHANQCGFSPTAFKEASGARVKTAVPPKRAIIPAVCLPAFHNFSPPHLLRLRAKKRRRRHCCEGRGKGLEISRGSKRAFVVTIIADPAPPVFASGAVDLMAGSMAVEFPACMTTHAQVNGLVAKNLLPKDEVVVCATFFERGLGLPTNCFLRGLLHFYEIELHHLNPNTVLQILAFIVLCEAYLGIGPNFALWRYFFHMCILLDSAAPKGSKTPASVRGAGVQLRGKIGG